MTQEASFNVLTGNNIDAQSFKAGSVIFQRRAAGGGTRS